MWLRRSPGGLGPLPDESIPEPDYNIPCYQLSNNDNYSAELMGRTEILRDIDRTFFPNKAPKTLSELDLKFAQLKTYCLHGPGGIGKSQLAAEYARSRKAHFDVIIWLDASDEHKLRDSYIKFANALGIHEHDPAAALNQVHGWLRRPVVNRFRTSGPFVQWLMILDAVDDPKNHFADQNWAGSDLGYGCLIVTGRRYTIRTPEYFGQNGVELDPLPKQDAAKMILQRTGRSREDNASAIAEAIAEDWGCFPITMVCIASFIRRGSLTLSDFLSLGMPERRDILLSDWSSGGKSYNLGVVWSFEHVSPEESTLLDLISLLNPSCIRESIFTRFPEEAFALQYFPGNQRFKTFEIASSALEGTFTLLRRKTEDHYPSIYIHRTIRDTLFARLCSSNRLQDTFDAAVGLVGSLFYATANKDVSYACLPSRERNECDALILHVESLVMVYEGMNSQLQRKCATYKWARLLAEAAWYVQPRFEQSLNLTRY